MYKDDNSHYNYNHNLVHPKLTVVPGMQSEIDKCNLETKLIDDTFYYMDKNYIYDRDTLEKVGYISDNEFILTDDPFILNAI
jgi:hypothetical protein